MKRLGLLFTTLFSSIGLLLTGFAIVYSSPVGAVEQTCIQPPTTKTDILMIYVLAYDNNPVITDTANLSYQYTDTVQGIVNATASNPAVRAVMLSDLDGMGDTQIEVAAGGTLLQINCLPDVSGTLREGINEYDTTNAETLGGFLIWTQQTYPADRNLFSYIGHGNFAAPDTGAPISTLLESPTAGRALSPLPDRTMANPNYTDFHLPEEAGQRLITPYDLATAFDLALAAGGKRFEVIDLLHCFAGSIDEFYELRNYADYIIGSPNYAFFDPSMPGAALANLSSGHSAENYAQIILFTYQSIIPPTQHPFASLAVETSQLEAVRLAWDTVSASLLAQFDESPTVTADTLETAYANSYHYDTTYCDEPSELDLAPPDALSDMFSFGQELALAFDNTPVEIAANSAVQAMGNSLPFNQTFQEGSPWFYEGTGAAPVWEFQGGGEAFYSVFTPFQVWTNASGEQYHTWQSLWYSSTTAYEIDGVTIQNSHPFSFIEGEKSWADVLARYWRVRELRPGVDVDTVYCGAPLRPLWPGSAEIALTIDDRPDRVQTGELVSYTVTIQHFGGTTATLLSVIHTLSPSMTLMTAPPQCDLNSMKLLCTRPNLPPNQTDTYTLVARMDAPGFVPFSGKLSMLQTGGSPTASETTNVIGIPLAVTISKFAAGNNSMFLNKAIISIGFLVMVLFSPIFRKLSKTVQTRVKRDYVW